MVAIDIVLSTSTDQAVRKQILDISRKARRPVETAWTEALAQAASGLGRSRHRGADTERLRGMALRTLWENDPKWFDECWRLAANDQGFPRAPASEGADAMNNGRAIPLINSVCYVRLAVSEPSASARFVSDVLDCSVSPIRTVRLPFVRTIAFGQ